MGLESFLVQINVSTFSAVTIRESEAINEPELKKMNTNLVCVLFSLYFTSKHRETVNANSTFEKSFQVTPLLANNKEKRGLAVDGRLKDEDTSLASTTL